MEWSVSEGVVQNYGSLGLEQWRVRIGRGGESRDRSDGTEVDFESDAIGQVFCLCGHVAIESDATAAIGMVHRLRLGKVQHLAVGDLWVQHHVR